MNALWAATGLLRGKRQVAAHLQFRPPPSSSPAVLHLNRPPPMPPLPPAPQEAQAGASVILQYNRLGGPIKGFDIPLEQSLTLRVGARGCGLGWLVFCTAASVPCRVGHCWSSAHAAWRCLY